MSRDRKDSELETRLGTARAAIDAVGALGFGGVGNGAEAATATKEVERLHRQMHAVALELQAEVDSRGLYAADGHASAKVLARHAAQLAGPEATRRTKAIRATRDLPMVGTAHSEGRIGAAQVDRIARVHANPRIRDLVLAHDEVFVELAEKLSYADLDAVLTDWERLADQDGAGDRSRRAHEQRHASIIGNYDGTFTLRGSCGGLQGVEMREIHKHYAAAEFKADWAEARDRLGDEATANDLRRTDAQRHLDALHRVMLDGAAALAGADGGSVTETNVLVDQDTFEREATRIAGADPGPDPRADTYLADAAKAAAASSQAGTTDKAQSVEPKPTVEHDQVDPDQAEHDQAEHDQADHDQAKHDQADPDRDVGRSDRSGGGFRCGTSDGQPLHPTEVVAQALVGHIRRVVLGADSVTIDMGRRSRLFTGPAALAARLGNTTCCWAGCLVAASNCQIDHLTPWAPPEYGSTCPDNGGPACGKHNRLKEHGFRVWRDPAGKWHTYRPDGTEI